MEEKVIKLLKDIEKTVFPFGKYKSEEIGEILVRDRDYVVWMSENNEGSFGLMLRFYLDNEEMV